MPRESLTNKRDRAKEVISRLENYYGEIECSLLFRDDPWRLMVAAILAAQCTDARVNLVTPALFARFPEMEDFAIAETDQIEPYIKSCGLFRNKAKSIKAAAEFCLKEYDGVIPRDFDKILKIPGVGRKIANLITGDCFGIAGIVVDTHCKRLSYRLGFTSTEDPTKAEKELLKIVEKDKQIEYGHLMVEHGRNICKGQKPLCELCPLKDICPKKERRKR